MTSAITFAVFVILLHGAALAFTAICGGKAERFGAALLVFNLGLTWTAQASGDAAPFYAFMLIDLLTAAGFAWLIVKNPNKLWPGLAGCAQFLIFVFSVTRAIEFPLSEVGYLVMLNLCSLLALSALAAGAWAARWGRAKPSAWDMAPA